MFQITDRRPLSPLASLLLAAVFHQLLSKQVLSAPEELMVVKDLTFNLAENSNCIKHKIWIKTKLTNLISKIMIKICLITKMNRSEFLKTKTEKKWRICKCPRVIFPIEKERHQPAKEARMLLKILERWRQTSWARIFKNRESFIIKNNRSFKIDLKSRFLRTNQRMRSRIASSKERRTWRQVQKRRKPAPSFQRLV